MIRDSRRPAEHQVCTVLVVADELLVRLTVAEELREVGMRVIEAGNADEAMEHLRAGNCVDLVFADIELPGSMNGLELAQRLGADFPDLKLLMTSGRIPAHEAAFIRPFIPKPYDIYRGHRPHPRRA
jgi:two-component system, response regulator PdtaR